MRLKSDAAIEFDKTTTPTPLQQHALDLLGESPSPCSQNTRAPRDAFVKEINAIPSWGRGNFGLDIDLDVQEDLSGGRDRLECRPGRRARPSAPHLVQGHRADARAGRLRWLASADHPHPRRWQRGPRPEGGLPG
jgi:hypothetical protein